MYLSQIYRRRLSGIIGIAMLYDKDIREPLFEFLEEKYGKVRIFEEKDMGASRADAVMVGENYLMGIEIKSDADSYVRLESQISDYDRYFDKNCIVVGGTHAKNVAKHVPGHWGIISVEKDNDEIDFYIIREPASNPIAVLEYKIRLLWRPELAHIQDICGLHKYAGKSKDFVRKYIFDNISSDKLNLLISDILFERDYSTIGEEIRQYRQMKNPQKNIRKRRKKYSRRKTLK